MSQNTHYESMVQVENLELHVDLEMSNSILWGDNRRKIVLVQHDNTCNCGVITFRVRNCDLHGGADWSTAIDIDNRGGGYVKPNGVDPWVNNIDADPLFVDIRTRSFD